jgi:hypothetical protein
MADAEGSTATPSTSSTLEASQILKVIPDKDRENIAPSDSAPAPSRPSANEQSPSLVKTLNVIPDRGHEDITTFDSAPAPSRPSVNEQTPSLVKTHDKWSRWPAWMPLAVSKLERYSSHSRWLEVLNNWLEFEDLLGYPLSACHSRSHRDEEMMMNRVKRRREYTNV